VSLTNSLKMAHIWLLSPFWGVGIVWVGERVFNGFLGGFWGLWGYVHIVVHILTFIFTV